MQLTKLSEHSRVGAIIAAVSRIVEMLRIVDIESCPMRPYPERPFTTGQTLASHARGI
jgi:hypothetical protein